MKKWAMLVACLGMLFWMTGCVSSTQSYQRYTIEIETDPTGVEVESDMAGHRVQGSTPTVVEGDFEYRVFEKSEHWYVPGITGGLFLAAGIILLANSRLTSTGEVRMGFLLGGIYSVMAGVALPTLSLHASLMDGNQQARRAGERRWQRVGRGVPMDQVVRALPRAELTLSRPGYQDRTVMAMPGDRLRLELAVDTAVASSERPRPDAGAGQEVAALAGAPFVGAFPQASSYALVIGVERYRSLPEPTGARRDAEEFARMLRESLGVPDRNVTVLLDDAATRSDIESELAALKSRVPAGSRIYFFFSGHGSPDVETGSSYVLPYEGTPENLRFSGISVESIVASLEETEAREVIAFVDSCFSGTGGRSLLPEGVRPLVPAQEAQVTSRVALFASAGAGEISGTLPGADVGLFTHHVLDGLGRGRADIDGDGQVSLEELVQYVTPRVTRDAREASRRQTPTLAVGEGLGEPAGVIVTWGVTSE